MNRKILLNPGPATTTDTVKQAQVVADICPREQEFGNIMRALSADLLRVVHADDKKYSTVLFCGSGTLNMDVCINSLTPAGKKILIINNGAYSSRAVEICQAYGLDFIDLQFPVDEPPKIERIEEVLHKDKAISVVYTTHQETGTGLLNPVQEIGALAHKAGAIFIVDTTSTLAMLPIDIENDNIDFCMASAQKGLQAMTGLSFIIGKTDIIEKSKDYPKRSYYCNLFQQYSFFKQTGQMQFTPPVQTIYAAKQALNEYFDEGELPKWNRHQLATKAIHAGLRKLGFEEVLPLKYQSGLVVSVKYPKDVAWNFDLIHDYCYERGFTIYPGKMQKKNTFRVCSLGAITEKDIRDFFVTFENGLKNLGLTLPLNKVRKQNDSEK
ncbi:MAG: 2-aminoethylphosphonate--pyruvate transaminase [Treponema sp.]|nr:2-aminoethylphosphonate--pyruvate transaminase [Treponema sp.]